jgi:hypothetical protein
MRLIYWNQQVTWQRGLACLILVSALAGCNREETKVYNVPKDTPPPDQSEQASAPDATQPAMPTPPGPAPSSPAIKYQLPPGWKEKPLSDMRVASFSAPGANGTSADISVIPLPVVGRDLELINMWRSKVQLPPTTDENAVKQFEPVAIGDGQGRLYDFIATQTESGKAKQRLLEAMLPGDRMSWFFKIAGDDAVVTSQKKNFLAFLKSVSFPDSAPPSPPAMEAATSSQQEGVATESIWTTPPGWQPVAPSQFLLAEYSIPGTGNAKAAVNVAALTGEGGGLLPNINRWRGQVGLAPISEDDLATQAQSLDVPGGKATLVDFAGTDAKTSAPTRTVGAIVSQNGETWFYKLMGDKQVVAQEKDNFTKFIQSANYANAR